MRSSSIFYLLMLSLQGSAGGAAKPPERTVKIACVSGVCTAEPPTLDYLPQRLVLDSPEVWSCTINADANWPCESGDHPKGTIAFLLLRSRSPAGRVVVLPVASEERGPVLLNAVNVLAAGLVLVLALGIAWFSLVAAKDAAAGAAALQYRIEAFRPSFEAIRTALTFPEPPQVGDAYSSQYPAPAPPPMRMDPGMEALFGEIQSFINYVNDCFLGLGGRSDPGLDKNVQDLINLIQSLEQRDMSVELGRAQFKLFSKTLSRKALNATDDDLNRTGRENPMAEAALKNLLKLAGLRLLVPQPDEPYAEPYHDIASQNEPDRGRGSRGRVARVQRRGLLDSYDGVVQKAVVVLYD